MKLLKITFSLSVLSLLGACASPVAQFDYTNYHKSNPASILLLPPVNNSPDMKATYGFLSTATEPLAEGGYYVFPLIRHSRRTGCKIHPKCIRPH